MRSADVHLFAASYNGSRYACQSRPSCLAFEASLEHQDDPYVDLSRHASKDVNADHAFLTTALFHS